MNTRRAQAPSVQRVSDPSQLSLTIRSSHFLSMLSASPNLRVSALHPPPFKNRAQKKADPGKVGFEWSWWKVLWVVGERTFHIGGRMAHLSRSCGLVIQLSNRRRILTQPH